MLLADTQRVRDPAHGSCLQQVVVHTHRQVAGDVLIFNVLMSLRGEKAAKDSAPEAMRSPSLGGHGLYPAPSRALTVPLTFQWTEGLGKAMALQVRFTTSSCRTYSGELMATIRGFPVGMAHQPPAALAGEQG